MIKRYNTVSELLLRPHGRQDCESTEATYSFNSCCGHTFVNCSTRSRSISRRWCWCRRCCCSRNTKIASGYQVNFHCLIWEHHICSHWIAVVNSSTQSMCRPTMLLFSVCHCCWESIVEATSLSPYQLLMPTCGNMNTWCLAVTGGGSAGECDSLMYR